MKLLRETEIDRRNAEFEVLTSTAKSEVAIMTLQPGGESGDYGNEHSDSEQWCYVLSGSGLAKVEGEETELHEGDLIVVEAGEKHQFVGTGKAPFKSLNFYFPKHYSA